MIIIGLYSLKDDDSQFWAVGDLFWVLGDYFGFGGTILGFGVLKRPKFQTFTRDPAAMYLSKSLELPASRSVCIDKYHVNMPNVEVHICHMGGVEPSAINLGDEVSIYTKT